MSFYILEFQRQRSSVIYAELSALGASCLDGYIWIAAGFNWDIKSIPCFFKFTVFVDDVGSVIGLLRCYGEFGRGG